MNEKPTKKTPERRCIVTGEHGTPETLLRFAVSPEGVLVFDCYQKLPGRGAWVTPNATMLQHAMDNKLFTKTFKSQVKLQEGFVDHVEERLKQSAYELLPLCQKSGLLISGYEKVKETFAQEAVAALIMASDASENAREKLFTIRKDYPLIEAFTREELGVAVGREQAVQIALLESALSQKFIQKMQCFTGFRDEAAL